MPESPKIILIVEDESSLLLVLHDRLQEDGFKILQAKNGAEALALSLAEHPDLILLDLLMPVMDGISMLKVLREDAWGKNAKIMVLTNLGGEEKLEEAKALGVTDYLIKADWKIEEVVQKIKNKIT
ncbi:MAG: response regulator [Candidatus Uhrbacteria bacterium]|nr:response regulator [Candidatus Uhrbacteria bacterium]